MAISDSYKHFDFPEYAKYYTKLEDCFKGTDRIKEKGTTYLPQTDGQEKDIKNGVARYIAYKERAIWYNYPQNTIIKSLGVLHKRPAEISLPDNLKYLEDSATKEKESLASFQLLVNDQQISYGRVGLLPDIDEDGNFYP